MDDRRTVSSPLVCGVSIIHSNIRGWRYYQSGEI